MINTNKYQLGIRQHSPINSNNTLFYVDSPGGPFGKLAEPCRSADSLFDEHGHTPNLGVSWFELLLQDEGQLMEHVPSRPGTENSHLAEREHLAERMREACEQRENSEGQRPLNVVRDTAAIYTCTGRLPRTAAACVEKAVAGNQAWVLELQ
jgi:hypothetical protein